MIIYLMLHVLSCVCHTKTVDKISHFSAELNFNY